jgi:hypothetical protein
LFVHSPIEILGSALGCPLSAGAGIGTAPVTPPRPAECLDLLDRFRLVDDGRSDTGRAHPVAAVLTLAAGAVVGGMRSFTAIAGFIADTPPRLLERLYARCAQIPAVPSKATIWRVVTGVSADHVVALGRLPEYRLARLPRPSRHRVVVEVPR